jgi:hypothetical protein
VLFQDLDGVGGAAVAVSYLEEADVCGKEG